METLERAFEPYRHLDPIGWLGVFRFLSVPVGLAVALAGGTLLLYGGRRLFRLVAGPLGALLALLWAGALASRLGFGSVQRQVTLVATFALLGTGLLVPSVVIFVAFGVPAGLLAGHVAGPADWLLGFAPGFLAGGAVGAVLHRLVAAVLSSAIGAWAFVVGAMATLAPFLASVERLARAPAIALGVAGCLATAGTIYQLAIRPSPEEAERRRRAKPTRKPKDKDAAEPERRWSGRGKKA